MNRVCEICKNLKINKIKEKYCEVKLNLWDPPENECLSFDPTRPIHFNELENYDQIDLGYIHAVKRPCGECGRHSIAVGIAGPDIFRPIYKNIVGVREHCPDCG